MKRFLLTLAFALALLPLLKGTADGLPLSDIGPVVGRDHGLHVDLWTDRDQDGIYGHGDEIDIFFRGNDDCYVTIYAIDTDGDVELLFPRYPDDGFVFGGVTYRLPDYYDEWDYRIAGPDGVAYLHAVATRTPRSFRHPVHGRRYHLGVDPVTGDPFLAINAINRRIIPSGHIHASATVSFFIGRRVWYPRYACYDCHGRGPRFDPYRYECPRYEVRLARHYDYWWAHDYHPVKAHLVFGGPFWRFELRTVPVHRRPHIRYIDCALGYGNYRPLRTITRPPHRVVYRSPVITTRRGYQTSYERVTYSDTRSRIERGDGSRIRTGGDTRTLDRGGSRTIERDGTSTRSRSDAGTMNSSSRSRSDAGTMNSSSRSRSETTGVNTSSRSRSETTGVNTSSRSRGETNGVTTTSRSRGDVPAGVSTPGRDRAATEAPSRDLRSSTRSSSSIALPDRGHSATPEHRDTDGGGVSRSDRGSSSRDGNTTGRPSSVDRGSSGSRSFSAPSSSGRERSSSVDRGSSGSRSFSTPSSSGRERSSSTGNRATEDRGSTGRSRVR